MPVNLVTPNSYFQISDNNKSDFAEYLINRFKEEDFLTTFVIAGITNAFDKREHSGSAPRDEILQWLWSQRNEKIWVELDSKVEQP